MPYSVKVWHKSVAKHFQPEQKQRMEKLVENLLLAFEQNLEKLDWMGAETKAQAHVS